MGHFQTWHDWAYYRWLGVRLWWSRRVRRRPEVTVIIHVENHVTPALREMDERIKQTLRRLDA